MSGYSTRQVAKILGLSKSALSRYIAAKKIPAPKAQVIGGVEIRSWTDTDIERVRKILPKIENGRKTRYKKQQKRKKNKS